MQLSAFEKTNWTSLRCEKWVHRLVRPFSAIDHHCCFSGCRVISSNHGGQSFVNNDYSLQSKLTAPDHTHFPLCQVYGPYSCIVFIKTLNRRQCIVKSIIVTLAECSQKAWHAVLSSGVQKDRGFQKYVSADCRVWTAAMRKPAWTSWQEENAFWPFYWMFIFCQRYRSARLVCLRPPHFNHSGFLPLLFGSKPRQG